MGGVAYVMCDEWDLPRQNCRCFSAMGSRGAHASRSPLSGDCSTAEVEILAPLWIGAIMPKFTTTDKAAVCALCLILGSEQVGGSTASAVAKKSLRKSLLYLLSPPHLYLCPCRN